MFESVTSQRECLQLLSESSLICRGGGREGGRERGRILSLVFFLLKQTQLNTHTHTHQKRMDMHLVWSCDLCASTSGVSMIWQSPYKMKTEGSLTDSPTASCITTKVYTYTVSGSFENLFRADSKYHLFNPVQPFCPFLDIILQQCSVTVALPASRLPIHVTPHKARYCREVFNACRVCFEIIANRTSSLT